MRAIAYVVPAALGAGFVAMMGGLANGGYLSKTVEDFCRETKLSTIKLVAFAAIGIFTVTLVDVGLKKCFPDPKRKIVKTNPV
ncbi:MAG: hypothetical protein LLG04_07825 [Parachlamydia sp.]|nr:hypothetical protein [Parachlamydia sp.]